MNETEVVRLVEETELEGLKDVSVEDVYAHIDVLMKERPGPLELYRRWERQNWSASALDFSVDRIHWEAFDEFTRESFVSFFAGFFVGEQRVTDTLSPLVHAAPDEESRLFLATQLVDEARHSFFFSRFWNEVVGVPGLSEALEHARGWANTKAYDEIFWGDLVEVTEAVREDPADYEKWIEAITLYHLMVEAMLALTGQKLILEYVRDFGILPAFRSGFTAVTRDESRHVNYGVWAIQRAVKQGHEAVVRRAVDRSYRKCLRIYSNPGYKIIIPPNLPMEMRMDSRKNWAFAIDALTKRLRVVGIDGDYIRGLQTSGWQIVWDAVAEYEAVQGEDHPVRDWQRWEKEKGIVSEHPTSSPSMDGEKESARV
jgi:ribonucleoside-diphosphate reductase beta chain